MTIYQKFNCSDCMCGRDGDCDGQVTCLCFSPTPEIEDAYVDELIEVNRIEYWKDWFKYFDEEDID